MAWSTSRTARGCLVALMSSFSAALSTPDSRGFLAPGNHTINVTDPRLGVYGRRSRSHMREVSHAIRIHTRAFAYARIRAIAHARIRAHDMDIFACMRVCRFVVADTIPASFYAGTTPIPERVGCSLIMRSLFCSGGPIPPMQSPTGRYFALGGWCWASMARATIPRTGAPPRRSPTSRAMQAGPSSSPQVRATPPLARSACTPARRFAPLRVTQRNALSCNTRINVTM